MVIGLAMGALTGLFEAAISTVAAPVLELGRQEVAKVLPVNLPAIGELVENYRRGNIPEPHFKDQMLRHGISEENQERVLFASKFFPGAADLVTFVVKEGFTPELIADLTKGEPTPQRFIDKMIELGSDKETADLYWITHYDPLGRQEFEEMFHRLNSQQLEFKEKDIASLGLDKDSIKFELEDLKRMFRIKDIYPGLRDRLALLSFKPISRIDVRRLEDFDIVDDSELEFMNREIGYSPNSASQLAIWTRINNTLKDIKPLLQSQRISFDDAERLLIEEGATPEAAKKLINRRVKITKKLRASKFLDKAKDEVLKRFINDPDVSIPSTIKDLMDLDMTEEEADAELAIAIVAQHADPTDDAEQRALIDTVRAAAGLPEKTLREKNKDVLGWNYTLDLEREVDKQVDRFIAENHKIGAIILDVKTGIKGEVLARVPIFTKDVKTK
jgi:hypothetical protein